MVFAGKVVGVLQDISAGTRRRIDLGKVVMVLTASVVGAILAGTALLLWDLRQREIAHSRGEIVSLSKILSEQTTRAFDGVDLVLRSVQDRLDDGIGQKLELDGSMVFFLLRARTSGLPQLASVFVVGADGVVMNSSRSSRVRGHSVADMEYFSAWQSGEVNGMYVSRPKRSRIDGKWSLYLSRRLSGPKGELRGVVVANVDLEYFQKLYSSISLDFVSPIFLTLQDGSLLVSQPQDPASIGKVVGHPGVRVKVLAKEGDLKLIEEEGVRTVAYRAVSNFPLAVGVAIGKDEALTPWRNIAWPIALGALLVSLAIAVAGQRIRREAEREGALTAALHDSNRQLRELSVALQNVREDERSRIARELHDELGQKLTGLKLEISWLLGRLRKAQPELVEKVEDMKKLLGDTIEETRRISSELRPLMLDDLGFAAAAEWMVQSFSKRTGIPVALELECADCVEGDPLATNLFRILQESLTNVMRHAEASKAQVTLRQEGGFLILRVADNGRGLALGDAGRQGGFGLLGIRERALALNGSATLAGAEGGGLVVEVRIPLETKGGRE